MGKATSCVALARVAYGPAESETQSMHANPLHGNREVPEATDSLSTIGPVEEGKGRDLNMHVTGKSDGGIVSMKRANKGAQLGYSSQPPAEFVEKRPSAKGNSLQPAVTGTQRPKAALIA